MPAAKAEGQNGSLAASLSLRGCSDINIRIDARISRYTEALFGQKIVRNRKGLLLQHEIIRHHHENIFLMQKFYPAQGLEKDLGPFGFCFLEKIEQAAFNTRG
jgi:hypothetical protein